MEVGERCLPVWLVVLRSDAARRLVFAAHVFGRQEAAGQAAQAGRACGHTSRFLGPLRGQQAGGAPSSRGARATSPYRLRPSSPRATEVKTDDLMVAFKDGGDC